MQTQPESCKIGDMASAAENANAMPIDVEVMVDEKIAVNSRKAEILSDAGKSKAIEKVNIQLSANEVLMKDILAKGWATVDDNDNGRNFHINARMSS